MGITADMLWYDCVIRDVYFEDPRIYSLGRPPYTYLRHYALSLVGLLFESCSQDILTLGSCESIICNKNFNFYSQIVD